VKAQEKRQGNGKGNWGAQGDQGEEGEGEQVETSEAVEEPVEKVVEKEPATMTYEEYMTKEKEKRSTEAQNLSLRKVDTELTGLHQLKKGEIKDEKYNYPEQEVMEVRKNSGRSGKVTKMETQLNYGPSQNRQIAGNEGRGGRGGRGGNRGGNRGSGGSRQQGFGGAPAEINYQDPEEFPGLS